jgi:nucleotide-binding universal stress UspA family protein
VIARHAAAEHARIVAVGPSPRGRAAQFSEGSFTATLAVQTPCTLVLVHPESELEDSAVVASPAAG